MIQVAETTSQQEPIVIKKYANRRLYNTETSSYVTLEHLAQMVKDGRHFKVTDAKTGEDITRVVLTQIIFEEENKGQTLLPINFLRQLISFYGHGLQVALPSYLEATMEMFARNQDRYRDYFDKQFGSSAFAPGKALAASFEEMARQNMAAFERATRMFSPFGPVEDKPTEEAPAPKDSTASKADELSDLKEQLRMMQEQINALSKRDK